MKKTLWIPVALAGALGYSMLDDESGTQTCYTSVTVNSTIDSTSNISVSVSSGGTTLCTGLEEGQVCSVPVEPSTTLAATFNTNRNQFVYVQAAGTNRAATITSTQGITSELGFAVVGVQGTTIAVEGDPKIQLVVTSCS
ncbi:MAG: hypothetical protein JNK45_13575 [Myxococcales bacterium]|nr:hypothetical protein [Myxococcales bacterium]